MRKVLVFLTSCLLLSIASSLADSNQKLQKMGSAHLCFTENKGQWNEDVKFRCDAGGAIVWICKDRIVYQFSRTVERAEADRLSRDDGNQGSVLHDPVDKFNQEPDSIEQLVITARFVNPNPDVQVVGGGMMEYRCNYFVGSDPNKWHTDVPNYEAVTLKDAYEGVNLQLFAGDNGKLMYQYDIAPSTDHERVKVAYEGLEQATISTEGQITAQSKWGNISGLLAEPASAAVFVFMGFTSGASQTDTEINSSAPRSPKALELIYSTYLGGTGNDGGLGVDYGGEKVTIDSSGNTFITGYKNSTDFPTQNAIDSISSGHDAFVTKLSSSGGSLIYSTYLGGSGSDYGTGIAVDGSGNAYVTGITNSYDFPTQNAYDASYNDAFGDYPGDVFVTKVTSSGNSLIYSTFIGGLSEDAGRGIAVDNDGNAYVTGTTQSIDFPTQNAYDASHNDGRDVFTTKLSSSGNSLVYSTYLGGSNWDWGHRIAVNGNGNAYVTGSTKSTNFPTQSAYDVSLNGSYDVFLTKFSGSGDALLYSTFLGGSKDDVGFGIAVDNADNAYITGLTESQDFPRQNALDATYNGGIFDAFVTKFSISGDNLTYSTFLGGSGYEWSYGIAVDSICCAYLTGYTSSMDFPTRNAHDPSLNGYDDVFATKLSASGNTLIYSTYLGGSGKDQGYGIAVDGSGFAYVTGMTQSPDFPTLNAYDSSYNGGDDVFVTKLTTSEIDSCDSGVDLDQDGIDDECDSCIDFKPIVTITPTDLAVRMKSSYSYYPSVLDPDGGQIAISYLNYPHWCSRQNDSVRGIAPDTAFVEQIRFELLNECNLDTVEFSVSVYLCGNANGDNHIAIDDAVYIINYIFADGPQPQPLAQADADCNGVIHIGDAVSLINYIFASGPAPCAACP